MIDKLRKNPAVLKTALTIITVLFCGGLFIPQNKSGVTLNGKRQLNQQSIQHHSQLLTQHYNLSEEEAIKVAMQQALQKINLSNQLEATGLQPTKKALVKYLKQSGNNKEQITEVFESQKPDQILSLQDDAAVAMLVSAIEASSLNSHIAKTATASQNAEQNIITVNLSKASYAVEMDKLKAFYKEMPQKPHMPEQVILEVINIPKEYSAQELHQFRRYIFQNPSDINAAAKRFNLTAYRYSGEKPDFLPEDLQQTSWFSESYISDILDDGDNKKVVQVKEFTPSKITPLEKSIAKVKQAYIESMVAPKVIFDLNTSPDIQATLKKYNLQQVQTSSGAATHRVYNNSNRINISIKDNELLLEKLVGYTHKAATNQSSWTWGNIESSEALRLLIEND
jgi:hypothetical protein